MEELLGIFENNDNVTFEDLNKYLSSNSKEIYETIIRNISRIEEKSKKKVIKSIAKTCEDDTIIDQICIATTCNIKYNYLFYKTILKIVCEKGVKESVWVEYLLKRIIEKSNKLIFECIDDFSKDKPKNVNLDMLVIKHILDYYDCKYYSNIAIEKEKIIIYCYKLNYIVTLNIANIIKTYNCLDRIYSFNEKDLKMFLDVFIYNYPEIAEKYYNGEEKEDSVFWKYIEILVKKYEHEKNVKEELTIFSTPVERKRVYYRRNIEISLMINKLAREKSVFLNMLNTNHILYGKKYGSTVVVKDREKIDIGKMSKIEYSYPFATEYIEDPLAYNNKFFRVMKGEKID